MGQKIVVGPITKGLRNDITAFNIDNDSFPKLINAYQWRGRIKRKRGTSQLGRLQRYFDSTSTAYNPGTTTQVLSAGGGGNLITGFASSGIQTNASIKPTSVTINDVTTARVYTDPSGDGTLTAAGGSGTINYATGAITISPAAADTINAQFTYYPDLPVMGLRELIVDTTDDTKQLGFDTTYSYNIPVSSPYTPYSVSFYKNPASGTINTIAYTQKTTATPVKWNGQDYQQFWSANYQSAFWETNGITSPYVSTNVGMQYKACASVTYVSATNLTITITEANSASLVVGDWVFVNEVTGAGGTADASTINLQTGFVSASAWVAGTTTLTVRFPYAAIAAPGGGAYAAGILQYLTANSDTTKDCLRWYDGDPTTGSVPYSPTPGSGWVNFCPPLSSASYSISDLPKGTYYLVGAKMIIPYKDRLLFLGPVVQTSSAGSQVYLPDTIIYSQNGVPYYTASFPGAPSATQTYTALLTPGWSVASVGVQTAQPSSFWEDVPGYGGFIQAGIQSPISTAGFNEDVLIVGFKSRQTRLIYSGNDIVPFNFYSINTELGSESTFSTVVLDKGVITIGGRGIVLTSQTGSQRIDLQIPDNVFQFNQTSSGPQRICSQRDYINEWLFFTYRSNESSATYPNQTLLYNYRDQSWAIFNETYTTYGIFRRKTGYTWATIGEKYPTWSSWNDPWSAGESTLLQPQNLGGNAQGFVMFLADGTNEGNSGYIKSFSSSVITSPGHGLNGGDYIIISGCIGTISSQVNGNIFQVSNPDQDTFTVIPGLTSATYLGLGVFKRMYAPEIQTKQFPVAWDMSRKTRIGPQQYLFTTTSTAQITLEIYLSQNASSPYNQSITGNNSLIYTDILYTCPESTNLGLTSANTNLQMPTAPAQDQTWHRMNTSLLGDTVQIGFTLSDTQMKDTTFTNQFAEIELHSMVLDVSPSQVLA